MSLSLTPAILEAAYEFLRTTPPFRGWNLPHADAVAFHVTRSAACYGEFASGDPPAIYVSDRIVGHTQTLFVTLAHEMIHLHHDLRGRERSDVEHGSRFRRDAARVCRHHGWDIKAF